MSQLKGLSSYPLKRNLDPIASYPLTRNLDPMASYPLTRNLDPMASYPLTRNLDPMAGFIDGRYQYKYYSPGPAISTQDISPFGDGLGGILSGAASIIGLFTGGGGGGAGGSGVTVNNLPPPQPAPPTPFNWTPVIVSGGVVLIALTLIMTTSRR